MITLIIGILIGAIGASATWFFIWANNKAKFEETLRQAESLKK